MLALPAPNPLINRVGNDAVNCFYTEGDYALRKI